MITLKADAGAAATLADLEALKLGAQTGTTSLTAIREDIAPTQQPLVFQNTNIAKQALLNGQVDAIVADLPTAFYITAVEIPEGTITGQFDSTGSPEEFGLLMEKGSELLPCVERRPRDSEVGRHARRDRADLALGRGRRTCPEVSDWSPSARQLERESIARRIRWQRGLTATAVTVVVLGVLGLGITSSPGWPRVQDTFFSWQHAKASFPAVRDGFWLNVRMFLIAEPVILVVGILVAVTRHTVSPWLTPLRALAVVYTDLFRGVPTLLVVFLCCIGIPALNLQGITNSLFWLGTLALVLSYGAYVAEVVRSGIDSIHPSQVASAEALALSRAQSMRYVVLPQALRRVVPPLMNDFVSLQKDTALVATVGVYESLAAAADYGNFNFNYTPLLVAAAFFVVMTVPLARFTDWLSARARRRERGGR